MYDVDHYLTDIKLKEAVPADDLVARTMAACEGARQRRQAKSRRIQAQRHIRLIALPAAAFLIIGILIGAFFFAPPIMPGQTATAYYTVDINPSIMLATDTYGKVLRISGHNDDAQAIIRAVDAVGEPVAAAIRGVIDACRLAGYLQDEQKYVLVGYFGDEDKNDQIIGSLQTSLEKDFGDLIDLLLVSGSLDEKQQADELHVSPALLKLSRLASHQLTDKVRIADLIEEVGQSHISELQAPQVEASLTPQGIQLSWQELNFKAMGYTGKVSYQIVAARTAREIENFSAKALETISFYTNEQQPMKYLVSPDVWPTEGGQTVYLAVYVQYHANLLVAGPAAVCQIPVNVKPTITPKATVTPVPTATPKPTATPVPTATPKPTRAPTATPKPTQKPTATPKPTAAAISYSVTGQIAGDQIELSWAKETAGDFSGYKVVASKTNPNPRYPDDGYLKYITDPNKTSLTLSAGMGGLEGGTSYYFSVTWLYQDGRKIAGNAVYLEVPLKPAPTPEPYLASQISGSITDKTVALSWDKISHSQFDGYKVMYSFSDPEPVYGDGSPYAYWITSAADTARSLDVTKLNGYSSGATVYFSISVLYDSHTIVKPGNVITFTVP